MTSANRVRWAVLVTLNVLFWCVLSFYGSSNAADRTGNQPFANAVEQRNETIEQLKEINAELKAQTAILQSGRLKVVLEDERK